VLTLPQGILLTGPPGSGKSLLLSLLYAALPARKARHHYHAFTLGLYQKVFAEMERRRVGAAPGQTRMNMEVAGRQGWRAVFASGRWRERDEDGAEKDATLDDPRDTIPFVSGYCARCSGGAAAQWASCRAELTPPAVAKEMILEYHVL
jgi:energy-coupling factor transporter ATP-binding protein EcfA2